MFVSFSISQCSVLAMMMLNKLCVHDAIYTTIFGGLYICSWMCLLAFFGMDGCLECLETIGI